MPVLIKIFICVHAASEIVFVACFLPFETEKVYAFYLFVVSVTVLLVSVLRDGIVPVACVRTLQNDKGVGFVISCVCLVVEKSLVLHDSHRSRRRDMHCCFKLVHILTIHNALITVKRAQHARFRPVTVTLYVFNSIDYVLWTTKYDSVTSGSSVITKAHEL
jgi:hypothetical protein